MQNKKLKALKYCGIGLLVIASIPIVLFLIFNTLYDLELKEAERKVINDYKIPLAVGETWEEEPFSFTLEGVQLVAEEDWREQISVKQYEHRSFDFGIAFDLTYSFVPKGTDEKLAGTFSFYSCAIDGEEDLAGPMPLPANLERDLTAQDHHYMMVAGKNAQTVGITINVPYGEKKYRKVYEFCVDDVILSDDSLGEE